MPRLVIGLSGPGPAQKNRQVSHDKIGLTEDVTEESFRPATSLVRRLYLTVIVNWALTNLRLSGPQQYRLFQDSIPQSRPRR